MTAILTATARPATATRTRWYRVQCGGYETIYTATGEPMAPKFVLDGFNLELEDTGFFGFGTREAIEAAALAQCPGKELIDFWPIRRPIAA
jgi:hypothetical protein